MVALSVLLFSMCVGRSSSLLHSILSLTLGKLCAHTLLQPIGHQTLKALGKPPVQLSWCVHMLKTGAAVSALRKILRRCSVGPHQHRRVHTWAFPTCPDLEGAPLGGNWKGESNAAARRVVLVLSSGYVQQEDLQVERCTCTVHLCCCLWPSGH